MRRRWTITITVALLLSLTALTAGAGITSAQGQSATLVSNTGQTSSVVKWSDRDHSQAFTTGAESSGYVITSVAFEIAIHSPGNTNEPTYSVSIWPANAQGKRTGTRRGALVRSGPLQAGINTFTPPTGGIHLAANTQYVVVFDFTARGDRDVRIAWTHSDAEDGTAAPSWSIADTGFSRTFNSNGAFNQIGGETDSVKIAVGGYAGASTFSRALHDFPDNFAQATHCGGTPNPAHRWDSGLGPYQTYYCNEDTGEWVTGRIAQQGVDYARDDQLEDAATVVDGETVQRCSVAHRWDPVRKVFVDATPQWDPIRGVCVTRSAPVDNHPRP